MIQKIDAYDGKINSKVCCDFMCICVLVLPVVWQPVSGHCFLDHLLHGQRGWEKWRVNKD